MLKRFDIKIKTDLEEPLLGLADVLGVSAFSSPFIKDQGKSEISFVYTGETLVSFIVSEGEQPITEIQGAIEGFLQEQGLPLELLSITEYEENQDWMASFKEYFKPIVVSDRIVVRPPWEPALEIESNENTKVILIDPGMAFGTGTHETTRLCLQLLEKIDVKAHSFVDLGAGSGILAFYLMMQGALSGVAIEIEGAAVENMRANAALNHISQKLEMLCADIASYRPLKTFDGLAANITSPVILEYLPVFTPWVKRGGWGVFSGINTTNAPEVERAFVNQGWIVKERLVENDWCGFLLEKA
jgi:ribosomal protein L11 methyltransferase